MEVDTSLKFVVVDSGKIKQTSPKKDLLKDLQKVYDSLAQEAIIFFNDLKSDKEKTDYLKTIKATKEKQRRNIALAVSLLSSIVILVIVIGLIIATGAPKEENDLTRELYTIISYSSTYFIKSITTALLLFYDKGFNKELLFSLLYTSLPLLLSCLGLGILKLLHVETLLALSLFEPGFAFSDWIKDLLKKLLLKY